jgi:hypothetical protein
MRASLKTNGPTFSATRMLEDYSEQCYGAVARVDRPPA